MPISALKRRDGGLDILGPGLCRELCRKLVSIQTAARGGNARERRMFSHQKLKVYGKALASVTSLTQRSAAWDKRHAVVDQLVRASESVVLNLAEGARLWTPAKKQHFLDYAIGSAEIPGHRGEQRG